METVAEQWLQPLLESL